MEECTNCKSTLPQLGVRVYGSNQPWLRRAIYIFNSLSALWFYIIIAFNVKQHLNVHINSLRPNYQISFINF